MKDQIFFVELQIKELVNHELSIFFQVAMITNAGKRKHVDFSPQGEANAEGFFFHGGERDAGCSSTVMCGGGIH